MTQDLNTLLTALYVKIDDELGGPRWMGRPPVLTDSELVRVAVAQPMPGFTSEVHWLRYARKHRRDLFPYLPLQSGYNKRLRAALGLIKRVIRMLAKSSDFWLDDCWIVDSTPIPCGMSRPHCETLGPGRMGGLRLLRQPLAVPLGAEAITRSLIAYDR
ncbi:hypothetical protein SAMN05660976_00769 [Nonomuraea pusilla]|uniref:Transposase DDE domain-containing protein n=1 Tax=Nonomuraea pusilla TaxID=46177 RepID=A0A1H7IDU5_9ACTN|nr:hypothetical protein [Nonomuraea pusilla]SEK60514.1 hypothetical protein SAMN05660976_00769 [Nonomuraea pusilla]